VLSRFINFRIITDFTVIDRQAAVAKDALRLADSVRIVRDDNRIE